MQYPETLALNDHEVVLTFDDGPIPRYTNPVLDTLASECVKATFFMVGKMARQFPRTVRRAHDEGHTLASHSENHPYNFYSMSVLDAAYEIETGFHSITAAVGDPAKVSPFFRFPGFHRQDLVEQYLASKGRMSWSVDVMSDDWKHIGAREIVRRVLHRLDVQGKGIVLMHDIKPATAVALPHLLDELRARGYRVVHVVAATPERPKTVTTAEEWRVAHPPTAAELRSREPSMWPRVAPYRVREPTTPLDVPSLASFGAEPDTTVPVTLIARPDALRNGDRVSTLPIAWPNGMATLVSARAEILPIPAADTFRYSSLSRARAKREKRDKGRHAHSANHSEPNSDVTGSVHGSSAKGNASKKSKSAKSHSADRPGSKKQTGQTGHQIQLPRPTANLQRRG